MAILIHDDIGNRLNILSLWLQNLNADNKEASEKIISNQISELIDSARSISHSLYPVNLEKLGLVLYVEELITNLSNKIKIILYVNPEYQKKDIFTEVQIYRMIQEFTTNVIKHSKATEMSIYIRDIKNSRIVILSDNGESFDYQQASKGMGLKNIEARIQSLNAYFKWKNRLNHGSRLIIIIPKNTEI
nr:ATP-binding protein [uncultured Chryseobacterium sp.]